MYSYANCTVFDIPLTWNRNRFEAARAKCRQARKLIEISVNVQFEKDLKQQHLQNMDVEKQIFECQETLVNHEKKVLIIENLIDVASESLPNYFDKRMEHVRRGVQEHCDAIQRLIREETEHWKEIHSAIDQNLVTAADFQVQQPNETEPDRIETIAEGDEVEEQEETQETEEEEVEDEDQRTLHENPSHYVNRSSVTSMLTQMIRKSQSRRHSEHTATTMESDSVAQSPAIRTKEERVTVRIPSIEFQFIRPAQDTTYFVKMEDQSTDQPSAMEYIPTENSAPLATSQTAASPIFSQPNPPARLYFSPTLLDEEPAEDSPASKKRKSILSPLDQNQITEPIVAVNRLGQTFVLNNLKSQDNNRAEQRSSGHMNQFVRPTITEEPCAPIQSEAMITEELEQPPIAQESIPVEPKRTRRTRAATKTEPKMTRPTRNTQKSVETTRRQTRKRKKSNSEETDPKSTTIALRKRRPIAIVDIEEKNDLMEKKPRKKREKKTTANPKVETTKRTKKKKKEIEIPIREPSPLPIIDRSKHYSMRFSTRSHRFNNFTLPMMNTENDDDHQRKKPRSTRGRPTRKPKVDEANHDEITPKKTKKMTKQTRNRKTKNN